MIRIERHRYDEKGVPIRPDADWFELAKEARATAIEDGAKHEALTSVYAHAQVRVALEKLFHDKCAYCEGNAIGQADWDVEHFRPKARVAERKDHPGYYWLAYEWSNLYPSCAHCNQKRRDRARWGDLSAADAEAKGKLDQFPLATETSRAMTPEADVAGEDPLLLDPCRDLPEQHLRFDVLGKAVAVDGSAHGLASIDVFHLNRKRLRDQRKKHLQTVRRLHVEVIGPLEKARGAADAVVVELRKFLDVTYLADDAVFAGVARWVVRDPASFGG